MIEAFKNPHLDRPTAIRLDGDTVYGHACKWGTEHLALPGVTPPRPADDSYRYFHLGGYEWQGQDVDVGAITLHTVHAPLRMTGPEAVKHYEDTGTVCAYVRAGNDEHGIWFSGKLAKGVDEADREALLGAKVSGDWRGYNGHRELIGMLAVNVPGFAVEREAALIAAGSREPLALVASGIVERDEDYDAHARLRAIVAKRGLAARVKR